MRQKRTGLDRAETDADRGAPAAAMIQPLLALALLVLPQQPHALERAAGWRALFDGQTTAGWAPPMSCCEGGVWASETPPMGLILLLRKVAHIR